MDFKKSGLRRVQLLVGRLKVVRLVGGFKEGVDLRSCNLSISLEIELRLDTGR